MFQIPLEHRRSLFFFACTANCKNGISKMCVRRMLWTHFTVFWLTGIFSSSSPSQSVRAKKCSGGSARGDGRRGPSGCKKLAPNVPMSYPMIYLIAFSVNRGPTEVFIASVVYNHHQN